MKLTLKRSIYLPQGTLGHLFLNGAPFCSTLERPAPQFPADVHCIPEGTYRVTIYDSPHFGRLMPLLMDVPGHSGIEIHWGNYPLDSKGCVLVGDSQSVDGDKPAIWNTRATFEQLFPEIQDAQAEGCTITIQDDSGS